MNVWKMRLDMVIGRKTIEFFKEEKSLSGRSGRRVKGRKREIIFSDEA